MTYDEDPHQAYIKSFGNSFVNAKFFENNPRFQSAVGKPLNSSFLRFSSLD